MHMRGLSLTFCTAFAAVALAATPGSAQINARTLTLAGVSDCVAEALANNAVDEDGVAIIFSCTAAKARTLYNFLGKKIRAEIVQDRNGKFENRMFGHSACYHRIEDQSGNSADEFRCDLIMAIGEALAE
jgi:hypothetical protein